jgi:hypothetical protein
MDLNATALQEAKKELESMAAGFAPLRRTDKGRVYSWQPAAAEMQGGHLVQQRGSSWEGDILEQPTRPEKTIA